MPSVTKYNSVHPEVVVAHVQSATANGEDEYDDDDALSPSIVGDYDEDRDDCEDDTSGTSESDIDDDDDDDDGGGGLGVNPESSDIEASTTTLYLHR
ncbi:hypothetical protein A1O3_00088 [Capronia epimyces CBS 606.96]|uniref:Uncharacterized protein n=1 Tax=Capronia epimyces CBS 606.96 TaxID=1182542 RepID=W9YPE8_9EURO|nr:uncharacterized protein A1O3_00088 [Capronia epimyces CBS 606.96]EXJ91540.1 hypothetical protein A1O3_00088 [Capronia epimyces CBS 606.96]